MSKKKTDEMEKERETFVKGALDNFVPESVANEIFDEMAGFAKYAFNKSHAAAYSITSYRTAYLKAHYPSQYYAALLTSVMGNTPKMSEYIADAKKLGISVLAPDINESDAGFTVKGNKIRFGLAAVKGVGEALANALSTERRAGAFKSFDDLVERMTSRELNRQSLLALISVGAFDSLGRSRSSLTEALDVIIESAGAAKRRNLDGQLDLFAGLDESVSAPAAYEYPDIPEYDSKKKLSLEREYIGVYISGSLLDGYSKNISDISPTEIADINLSASEEDAADTEYEKIKDRQSVSVVGIITAANKKATKSGDMMAIITLEDRRAQIKVLLFSKVFEKYAPLISADLAVSVFGEVSMKDDGSAEIIARRVEALVPNEKYQSAPSVPKNEPKKTEAEARPAAKTVYIKVPSIGSEIYKRALATVSIFDEGSTDVVFYDNSSATYHKMSSLRTDVTANAYKLLCDICGRDSVILR